MKHPHQLDISSHARRMAEAGIYSENPEVNQKLIHTLPELESNGIRLTDARPIPYGSRMMFEIGENAVAANLYYSAKKGYSLVIDRSTPEFLRISLLDIFHSAPAGNTTQLHPEEDVFHVWIGSDEAGKGDYLGPLVVAAFRMDRPFISSIRHLGIKDSKAISDAQCRSLARTLFSAYPNRISVMELVPETYNRLYQEFTQQNKRLNHLLSWVHAKAIENIYSEDVDGIVIDKFAEEHVIRQNLKASVPLSLRVRAEDNIAVAAASVLARARYLYRLEKLSDMIGVTLIPGAGSPTDKAAREAVMKHGPEILNKIAKRHFKNTDRILG